MLLFKTCLFITSGKILDKIIAPSWNYELELPDGSSSVSDIQGYSNNFIEKYEAVNSNPSIDIYISRFNNRLVSKIKDGCKLEFQNLKP